MQREAFYTLYELEDSVIAFADAEMRKDWVKLQSADHFYYMSTGQSDSDQIPPRFSPYHSPYQAFINYMNVLSDLKIRLENEAAAQKKRKEKEALPYPIRSEAETRGEAAIQEETVFR